MRACAVHASIALVVLLAAAAPARIAAAAPPDAPDPPGARRADVTLALVSGVATALIPIALGGMHTASAPVGDDGARNVGFAVAGVGPALAPIVAHAVLGEWKRAAAFGAVPVGERDRDLRLLAGGARRASSTAPWRRAPRSAILYTADLLGAAVGLVDVMMAPERARERRGAREAARARPHVRAQRRPGRAGFVLGGCFEICSRSLVLAALAAGSAGCVHRPAEPEGATSPTR